MIETGPVRKRLRGQVTGEHIHIARKLLGIVKARMHAGGLGTLVDRTTLAGVHYQVGRYMGQDIIDILVPPSVVVPGGLVLGAPTIEERIHIVPDRTIDIWVDGQLFVESQAERLGEDAPTVEGIVGELEETLPFGLFDTSDGIAQITYYIYGPHHFEQDDVLSALTDEFTGFKIRRVTEREDFFEGGEEKIFDKHPAFLLYEKGLAEPGRHLHERTLDGNYQADLSDKATAFLMIDLFFPRIDECEEYSDILDLRPPVASIHIVDTGGTPEIDDAGTINTTFTLEPNGALNVEPYDVTAEVNEAYEELNAWMLFCNHSVGTVGTDNALSYLPDHDWRGSLDPERFIWDYMPRSVKYLGDDASGWVLTEGETLQLYGELGERVAALVPTIGLSGPALPLYEVRTTRAHPPE